MDYYIREVQWDENVQKTAGIKARDDAEAILAARGWKEVNIPSPKDEEAPHGAAAKIAAHKKTEKLWEEHLAALNAGDRLLVQFPCVVHSIFLADLFGRLDRKGIKVILLIHDLELLRAAKRKDKSFKKRVRLWIEEKRCLKSCTKIIAHNREMIRYLQKEGIARNRLINLGIFDYRIPDFQQNKVPAARKDDPVIIAGTLRPHKAKYAYELPGEPQFALYGVGYEAPGQENVVYYGAFEPDELPFALKGSFGLVWDGDSADTCSGIYGEYLRINNPHKTSLYLAAGIPVAVWKEAALAKFVEKYGCGITVSSIAEIAEWQKALSEEEYAAMRRNAGKIGKRLRGGEYLTRAVEKA